MLSRLSITTFCNLIIWWTLVESKFTKIYSFGDSVSDNGNFYQLLNKKYPQPNMYFEGRFSNGPVWVEYLSKNIGAQLIDLAYAGATTDNDMFPAAFIPDKAIIPGCIQQVQSFLKNYKIEPKDAEGSLVTIAFMGNDFFHLEADAKSHVENQEKCLKTLLNATNLKNVMAITSNAPDIYPLSRIVPFFLAGIVYGKNSEIPGYWITAIDRLKKLHPEANFYNLDFRGAFKEVADGKLLLGNNTAPAYKQSICLGNREIPECPDPNNAMFWDNFHPTTAMHKMLATKALELIMKSNT